MEILKKDMLDGIIVMEMTVRDFLSFYLAKMTCNLCDFDDYQQEIFPDIESSLFIDSVDTEEMEYLIDELRYPHEEWL